MRMILKSVMSGALIFLATITVSGRADAGVCATALMNVYGAAGFTCTIGNMTLSDFSWTPTGGAPADTTETVVPKGLGFEFDGLLLSGSGAAEDAVLDYLVTTSDGTNTITKAILFADGSQTGTGIDGVDEVLCAGGMLGACPAGGNHSLHVTGNGVADQIAFAGVNEVDVQKDIFAAGGTSGSAELSSVTNVVDQPVPEPASLAVLAIGLLGLGAVRRVRK
jgi:PEP-CTERM motif